MVPPVLADMDRLHLGGNRPRQGRENQDRLEKLSEFKVPTFMDRKTMGRPYKSPFGRRQGTVALSSRLYRK